MSSNTEINNGSPISSVPPGETLQKKDAVRCETGVILGEPTGRWRWGRWEVGEVGGRGGGSHETDTRARSED